MVFHFKVQIKGITKPPVWRKLAVPAQFTFEKFHLVIQDSFGWEDYHLFKFTEAEYGGEIFISEPLEDDFFDEDYAARITDSSEVKLKDIFDNEGQKLLYIYDFGDNWVHQITLEKISQENKLFASCTGGKGACPPEDCGGVWSYMNMKEIFANAPDSDEAKHLREWLELDEDEDWELINSFDMEEVNLYLKDI